MEHSISGYLDRQHLPEHATPLRLLGVDYAHLPTSDGGDIYVTWYGIHLIEHLQIENWYESEWFKANRQRLPGTGTVYRVVTKPINGRSVDLVVKYCRVGEHVPLDTMTFSRFENAEFNSPYEEFSRVTDLRSRRTGPRVLTHRPLAIYVPAGRVELWQSGRDQSRIARKKARYRDVELDIFRQYVLIYEWVKGISLDDALVDIAEEERRRLLTEVTESARLDLETNGYVVMDHKPAHIIVRPGKGSPVVQKRNGSYAYALVDFELLARTPDYQRDVQSSRRAMYLKRERDRFLVSPRGQIFPEHLRPVRILGEDYVFGHAESTQGRLWVLGHDPNLFDYFLPERWRHTPGKKLSERNETHFTRTKDNINLVWKLSRVGEPPELDPSQQNAASTSAYGFNSPFEEFTIALDLARKGISTVYPRAIYMSGLESSRASLYVLDQRRFESHKKLVVENGQPLFGPNHNYLTIWGYWNGVAEMEEDREEAHLQPINLDRALARDLITQDVVKKLLARLNSRLQEAGYCDWELKPSHVLLSLRHDQSLVVDSDQLPAVRLCNFELVQRTADGTLGDDASTIPAEPAPNAPMT